eukprot:scaffold1366_cov155-Skeletonema_menzelii.AAC.13
MFSQPSSNKSGGCVAAKTRIASVLFVGSNSSRNQVQGNVGLGILAKDSLDDLSREDYFPRAPLKDRLAHCQSIH